MRGKALRVRLALVAAAAAIATAPLFSQAFYGSIVGTVTDQSSAAVHGATVTLTNLGTAERHQTVTGAVGDYQFLNLVPGNYEWTWNRRLQASHGGIVEVTVSGAVRADISMQVGEMTQTVEVQATAPLLQTENANLSQVVNSRSVEELPVNGRNILNLTALVPGVVPQGTTEWQRHYREEHVRGRQLPDRRRHREPERDLLRRRSGQCRRRQPQVNMVPSPDAISEFRVQTNSNSAEYGRYAGGVINITSKSGTNQFHGSAYEYFRNKVAERQHLLRQRQWHRKAAVYPEPVRRHGRGADQEEQDLLLRRLGRLCLAPGSQFTWRPCRFRPCIPETSRATRTRRAR